MSSVIEQDYGTSNQSITCTITSLANNGQRASTAIDNTGNLFFGAKIFLKIKSASSSTSATGVVNVYLYETADGGTTYSENASGTDASITLTSPPNVRLIGVVNVVANSTTYYCCLTVWDLPDHWGIIVENKSGATLDASVGSAWYQGLKQQAA